MSRWSATIRWIQRRCESEVEVLRSDSIAIAVVKDLKLTDDPEFVDTKPGLCPSIFGGSFGPPSEDVRNRIAVSSLKANLTVRRVGLTYVVEVSFPLVWTGRRRRGSSIPLRKPTSTTS